MILESNILNKNIWNYCHLTEVEEVIERIMKNNSKKRNYKLQTRKNIHRCVFIFEDQRCNDVLVSFERILYAHSSKVLKFLTCFQHIW